MIRNAIRKMSLKLGILTALMMLTSAVFATNVHLHLKNHSGVSITDGSGTAGYHNGSWNNLGATNGSGDVDLTLAPGSYYFNMKYNGYTQQVGPLSVSGTDYDVNFQTTLVTFNLKDHNDNLIPDANGTGIAGYNAASTWYSLGSTSGGQKSIELLPGAGYYFNMKYHNYTQQVGSMSVSSGGSWTQNIDFRTVLVSLNLKDHTGTSITAEDGIGGYNTGAWYSLGGTGMNSIELLPGSGYFFNMKFHNYTQQIGSMSVTGGGSWMQNVDFQTTLVTLNLKDHTGALITAESGTGGYNTGAWYSLGSTYATGKNQIELLSGSGYFFNMKYNNYTQQIGSMSVTNNGGTYLQDVDFRTTLVSVNLKNCAGSLINTSAATVQYNTGAWYTIGTVSGGTITKELLPGSGYYFNMTYNHGIQQKGSMSVNSGGSWTQDVDFNTTKVTFHNPNNSTIQYNQGAWFTFTPNTMELLPGNYYFQVASGTTVNKSVSGCAVDYYIAPSGTLSINTLNNGGCGGSFTLTAPAGSGSYSWSNGATTQATVVTASGVYSVVVTYDFTSTGAAGGTSTYTTSVTATPNTVTVRLVDSKGNGIAGGSVSYYNGGWYTFGAGTTDADGYACATLPTSSSSVKVSYKGGAQQWNGVYSSTNPVLVATTSAVTVNIKDHNGNLITAESASASCYQGSWVSIGSTGTDGFVKLELLPGSYAFRMAFHNASYQPANFTIGTTATDVDFTTTLVSVNLKDCAGNLLNGSASVSYYGNSWSSGSSFSTGTIQIEMLPVNYAFAMSYNNTRQQISATIGSGPTQDVDFNTTKVTFSNPNNSTISYYQSGWNTFTSNSMELLPGSVIFKVASGSNVTKTISGCSLNYYIAPSGTLAINTLNNGGCGGSFTLTAPASGSSYLWSTGATTQQITTTANGAYSVTVGYDFSSAGAAISAPTYTTTVTTATSRTVTIRLIDSKGNPIAGGTVKYYNGSWLTFGAGTTDANGYACMNFPTPTFTTGFTTYFQVTYCGGTKQWSGVAVAGNPILVAQTTNVSLNLKDHNGSLITAESGIPGYYSGTWNTLASTGANGFTEKELLPGAYYFNMKFHNYTQQQSVTVAATTNQDVDFQTTLVTLNLKDHTGTLITAENGVGGWYAGTWSTLGSTNTTGMNSIELLPGTGYYFNMKFHNYTQQKAVTVAGTTQDVDFQTTLVTLNLKDHTGANITTNNAGTGGYYAGSWYTLGGTGTTGTNAIELLPGTGYYFNMKYNNFTQQQAVTVNTTGTQCVNFQTTLVTLNLKDHTGTLITAEDGIGGWYAGTWSTLGSTNTTGMNSIELLPGTGYYFNMKFHNYTQQKAVTVAGTTQDVDFQTTLVTLNLKDHTGTLITSEDGTGGYYAGTWSTMGTTSGSGMVAMEFLPGTGYYFNMCFHHGTQQIATTVTATTTQDVNFTTALVTIHFQGKTGIAHSGATIGYYSGAWYTLGLTDVSGNASIEVLPVAYYYNATLTGYGTTQVGSFTDAAGGTPTHVIQSNVAAKQGANPGTTATTTETVEFSVFPNPATDRVTVKFNSAKDGQVSVKLADMSGKVIVNNVVNTTAGTNVHEVELNNLANGMYMLMFENGENTEVRKIVVQH